MWELGEQRRTIISRTPIPRTTWKRQPSTLHYCNCSKRSSKLLRYRHKEHSNVNYYLLSDRLWRNYTNRPTRYQEDDHLIPYLRRGCWRSIVQRNTKAHFYHSSIERGNGSRITSRIQNHTLWHQSNRHLLFQYLLQVLGCNRLRIIQMDQLCNHNLSEVRWPIWVQVN